MSTQRKQNNALPLQSRPPPAQNVVMKLQAVLVSRVRAPLGEELLALPAHILRSALRRLDCAIAALGITLPPRPTASV